ncbi:hypothetical protein [Corynebacterium freiburgense]|nr:hypothetical protein [Corynebacterium freiburgense]WJZ03045.1 hypothetical protein CFREI_08835 [Corynebacterium freiburgense]
MVVLRRTAVIFAMLTILLLLALGFLNSPKNSEFGGFYLFDVSLLLIICIFTAAVVVCMQWRMGEKHWLITRVISVGLTLSSLVFLILLLVADKESGANIGLGLLGLAIHSIGLLNAIFIVVHALIPAVKRKN